MYARKVAAEVVDHDVSDTYAAELYSIEEVGGGNLRFTFISWQRSTVYPDRRKEAHVVLRLIMPVSEVPRAAEASQLAADGVQGLIHGIQVEINGISH